MKFVRLAAVLFLAALAASGAYAAEPTTDEKVRYLIQGVDADMDINETFKVLAASIEEALGAQDPEVHKRLTDIMHTEFNKIFPDLTAIYVDAYKAIFAPEDIDRLYAFYSTPEGTDLLKKTALASSEVSRSMLDRTNLYYRNVNKAIASDPVLSSLLTKPPKDL